MSNLNQRRRKARERKQAERKALVQANVSVMPALKSELRETRVRHVTEKRFALSTHVDLRPHKWTSDDARGIAGTVGRRGKVTRAKVARDDFGAQADLAKLKRELRAAEAAGLVDIKFNCPFCSQLQTPNKGFRFFPTGRTKPNGKPELARSTVWYCGATVRKCEAILG